MSLMSWWRSTPSLAFCSIATSDYLPEASILIDSIRSVYGERAPIAVLLLGEERPSFSLRAELVGTSDIGCSFHEEMAGRYNRFSLSCAYKPLLLDYVRRKYAGSTVVYLDADMELFSPLEELQAAAAARANLILLPHAVEPRFIGRPVDDRALLKAGAYNAGILAVSGDERSAPFLQWWAQMNRTECYYDPNEGYYVLDQKWLSLAPSYFDGVHVLRHRGYNIAHFNLDERADVIAAGDIRTFHYTMLKRCEWDVDRYLADHEIRERRTAEPVLRRYAQRVIERQHMGALLLPG
jgi:hypothetical protein